MSVKIFYNGVDFFSSKNLPTPVVSRSSTTIQMGEVNGIREQVILEGKIYIETPPADCDYFSEITKIRDDLFNFFSQKYKPLTIKQDGTTIFEKDFCDIKNIVFENSNYVKTLPYSIEIECYDEKIHNEFFEVKEAENSTNINKDDEDFYTISRTLSAIGVSTQDGQLEGKNTTEKSNALQNAIDFVDSLKVFDPVLPEGQDDLALQLISENETIDRIKNFYQINQEYQAQKNISDSTKGVLRYTIDQSRSFGEVKTVQMSGELNFSKNTSFSDVRSRFKQINFLEEIEKVISIENLNKTPKSLEISENDPARQISFKVVFDDDQNYDACGVSEKVQFSIEEDGEKIVVNVSGSVESLGPQEKRWDFVKDKFYNASYDNTSYESRAHQLAQEQLNIFYSSKSLNGTPESFQVSEDENNNIIQFNYVFNNEDKLDDFKNFECNVSVKMSSNRYSIDVNAGGGMNKYIVSKAGQTVPVVSVGVQGSYKNFTGNEVNDRATALNLLRNKLNEKFEEVESEFFQSYNSTISSNAENFLKNENIASINQTREYYDFLV